MGRLCYSFGNVRAGFVCGGEIWKADVASGEDMESLRNWLVLILVLRTAFGRVNGKIISPINLFGKYQLKY